MAALQVLASDHEQEAAAAWGFDNPRWLMSIYRYLACTPEQMERLRWRKQEEGGYAVLRLS